MSEEKAVALKPIDNIRNMLEKSKNQIAMALPRHLNADRMLRIAVTAAQKTPKLLECRPVSLIGAVIQCAQLGLEPNDGTGRAWLIPYGQEVQFIPGYRGLVDLARRSGEIKRFDARAVFAKDTFKYEYGLKPELKHVPAEGDHGELTHVYAVAEFKDGGIQFEVMTRSEVDAIRKRSKASNNGPWVSDYEAMAKKTVVRRICKMLPVSAETQQAITLDERAELGLPQNLAMLADPVNEKPEAEKPNEVPKVVDAEEVEESEAEDRKHGKFLRVAKTKLGEKDVFVITKSDDTKLYTELESVASFAKKAAEEQADVNWDESSVAGRLWVTEVSRS